MSSISNRMSPFSSPSVADRWFRVLLLRRFSVFFYNNINPLGFILRTAWFCFARQGIL
jgi:hypothetical protein